MKLREWNRYRSGTLKGFENLIDDVKQMLDALSFWCRNMAFVNILFFSSSSCVNDDDVDDDDDNDQTHINNTVLQWTI